MNIICLSYTYIINLFLKRPSSCEDNDVIFKNPRAQLIWVYDKVSVCILLYTFTQDLIWHISIYQILYQCDIINYLFSIFNIFNFSFRCICDRTSNHGVTQKPANSLKGVWNSITWKPDDSIKGIRDLGPIGIRGQCTRGLNIPT